eukprot:scaffold536713_cov17-Prasinocladus_malaysianus.AAC.1
MVTAIVNMMNTNSRFKRNVQQRLNGRSCCRLCSVTSTVNSDTHLTFSATKRVKQEGNAGYAGMARLVCRLLVT